MAVSGSTDFKSVANSLIIDARRLLGVHAEEEPLAAHEQQTGMDFLSRMLKSWEADGIGSWVIQNLSLTLVQGQASYLFGAGGAITTVPFEVLADPPPMISRAGGNQVEMTRLSRGEYQRLPNKTSQGFPTQLFYDRQRDNGTLYVWPTPDASLGTISLPIRRRIMDIDTAADDYDLPPEWEEAIVNGLAKRLIPVYSRGGTPEAQQVVIDAERFYQNVKGWDTGEEEGSITFEMGRR